MVAKNLKLLAVVLALVLLPMVMASAPGDFIPFQGFVRTSGATLTGEHNFTFLIYDIETGATLLEENQTLNLTADGIWFTNISNPNASVAFNESVKMNITLDGQYLENATEIGYVTHSYYSLRSNQSNFWDSLDSYTELNTLLIINWSRINNTPGNLSEFFNDILNLSDYYNITESDSIYLLLNGSNANQNINVSPYQLIIGNLTIEGYVNTDVMPSITLSYDIGSGTNRWRWIYGQNISAEYMSIFNIVASENITASNVFASNICYSDGTNCTNSTQSPVNGSGTTGYLPIWTSATELGDSWIWQDATSINITGGHPLRFGSYGYLYTDGNTFDIQGTVPIQLKQGVSTIIKVNATGGYEFGSRICTSANGFCNGTGNESVRFDALIGNCSPGYVMLGVLSNGTKVCVADATGAGASDGNNYTTGISFITYNGNNATLNLSRYGIANLYASFIFQNDSTIIQALIQNNVTLFATKANNSHNHSMLVSTNSGTTLTLTDDGTNQILTGNTGDLNITSTDDIFLVPTGSQLYGIASGTLIGNVGVAPQDVFHVYSTGGVFASALLSAGQTIQNSGAVGSSAHLRMVSGASGTNTIFMGDEADYNELSMQYTASTGTFTIDNNIGDVDIIIDANDKEFYVEGDTASTIGSSSIVKINRDSSGTISAGFGTGVQLLVDGSPALDLFGIRGTASGDGDLVVNLRDGGSASNLMRLYGGEHAVSISEDGNSGLSSALGTLHIHLNEAGTGKDAVVYEHQDNEDGNTSVEYLKQDDDDDVFTIYDGNIGACGSNLLNGAQAPSDYRVRVNSPDWMQSRTEDIITTYYYYYLPIEFCEVVVVEEP